MKERTESIPVFDLFVRPQFVSLFIEGRMNAPGDIKTGWISVFSFLAENSRNFDYVWRKFRV